MLFESNCKSKKYFLFLSETKKLTFNLSETKFVQEFLDGPKTSVQLNEDDSQMNKKYYLIINLIKLHLITRYCSNKNCFLLIALSQELFKNKQKIGNNHSLGLGDSQLFYINLSKI